MFGPLRGRQHSIPLDGQDLRQSGPIRTLSEQGIIDWLSGNRSLICAVEQLPRRADVVQTPRDFPQLNLPVLS
jgi:hypothetical protein